MIKHIVNDKPCNKMHKEIVHINSKTASRVRRCLESPSLEEMSDSELEAWGFEKDYYEEIFCVKFDDGAKLSWRLGSGTHNYYDDVEFAFPDGTRVNLDCCYEFDDIEVSADADTYIVKLEEDGLE